MSLHFNNLCSPQRRCDSPYINRFLSADTIVPSYGNPQSLNRYSYVLNNPLRYVDPTGHRQCEDYQGSCVSENQVTGIRRMHLRLKRHYRDDTPKDDAIPPTVSATPINMQVILLTATATMPTTLQITLSAPQCTSGYPCVGQFYPSATPTATPIPHHDNKFPASSVVPSIFSWPPDFAPNADDIWDIIGGALPLINTPATSLNQIANNIVNTGSNAINAVSNTVTNTGAAVNEAIGNGLNYGPVMPIFIIPSPYDLFPITSQGPVYN